jgi:transposase
MTGGELNEVSAAIGELRGEFRMANVQRAETNQKLDEVSRKLDALAPLVARVNRIEPLVDAHERQHQRNKAVAGMIGIAGGGVGAAAWTKLKTLFGGGP